MRISKWGNSLAVRLPAALVTKLNLKEGDEVSLQLTHNDGIELQKKQSKREIIESLRQYRGVVPEGYRFNREELYERGDES